MVSDKVAADEIVLPRLRDERSNFKIALETLCFRRWCCRHRTHSRVSKTR